MLNCSTAIAVDEVVNFILNCVVGKSVADYGLLDLSKSYLWYLTLSYVRN